MLFGEFLFLLVLLAMVVCGVGFIRARPFSRNLAILAGSFAITVMILAAVCFQSPLLFYVIAPGLFLYTFLFLLLNVIIASIIGRSESLPHRTFLLIKIPLVFLSIITLLTVMVIVGGSY